MQRRLKEGVTIDDLALDGSGQWAKMPRLMLAKCAEMQALRRGWPDDLSSVYEHSELDQARIIDIDPIEAIEESERQRRLERVGGPQIMVCFDVGSPLESVSVGKLADRCIDHLRSIRAIAELNWFKSTNNEAFKQLWAHDKAAGLSVNKAFEDQEKKLNEMEANQS